MHTSSTVDTRPQDAASVLRWVMRSGTSSIACELEMNLDRTFDVRLFPSWNQSASFAQHFASATAAFERHAELATQLREFGWSTAEYTRAAVCE